MTTTNAVAPAVALDAKTTQKALQEQPVVATREYPFTVMLYEEFGRAQLRWVLDPNYAIGAKDVVQLREGSTWVNNWPVTGSTGTVDTGHVWGSGLNASYWAWNYPGAPGWRQLVVTPNTTDQ